VTPSQSAVVSERLCGSYLDRVVLGHGVISRISALLRVRSGSKAGLRASACAADTGCAFSAGPFTVATAAASSALSRALCGRDPPEANGVGLVDPGVATLGRPGVPGVTIEATGGVGLSGALTTSCWPSKMKSRFRMPLSFRS